MAASFTSFLARNVVLGQAAAAAAAAAAEAASEQLVQQLQEMSAAEAVLKEEAELQTAQFEKVSYVGACMCLKTLLLVHAHVTTLVFLSRIVPLLASLAIASLHAQCAFRCLQEKSRLMGWAEAAAARTREESGRVRTRVAGMRRVRYGPTRE